MTDNEKLDVEMFESLVNNLKAGNIVVADKNAEIGLFDGEPGMKLTYIITGDIDSEI